MGFYDSSDDFTLGDIGDAFEMRELIIDKKRNIHCLEVKNHCTRHSRQLRYFHFFVKFILANNNGETPHFKYWTSAGTMWFQCANQLANAIQSNNHGHIESFSLTDEFFNLKTFQPIWDAVLHSGVRELGLRLRLPDSIFYKHNHKNNILDFSNLRTNTSLKELIFYPDLQQEPMVGKFLAQTNLFDSIRVNKGIEKLRFNFDSFLLEKKDIQLFQTTMRKNYTLVNVKVNSSINQQLVQEKIRTETTTNQKWKRYLVKRSLKTSSVATATTATTTATTATTTTGSSPGTTSTAVMSTKERDEEKKRFEMRLLLRKLYDTKNKVADGQYINFQFVCILLFFSLNNLYFFICIFNVYFFEQTHF